MLIRCPKCRAVYDLPEKLMPPEGLKMRCNECGEIWVGHKRDALKMPKKDCQNIQQIFECASEDTLSFGHDESPVQVVHVPQVKYTFNLILFIVALFFIAFWLFAARYEIVRLLPCTEKLYSALSIDSIPVAQNLEFRDITTREFVRGGRPKLEICGKIVNAGTSLTLVPPVKIKVTGENSKLSASTIYQPTITRLRGGYDILFNVVIDNPTPQKKSVYLTFHDRLSGEK